MMLKPEEILYAYAVGFRDGAAPLTPTMLAEIEKARADLKSLPVIESCGECGRYDSLYPYHRLYCTHPDIEPGSPPNNESYLDSLDDPPPSWCPHRQRST